MEKINFSKIYDFLFALLVFILPFSYGITNICLAVLTILFFIKFKKQTIIQHYEFPFAILSAIVFYLIFQAVFNFTFIQDSSLYSRFGYLVIMPFLVLKVKNRQLIKLVAILSINSTIIFSLFKIAKFYSKFHFLPLSDGWATNAVLLLERPYAGIFSLICIVLSLEQLILKTRFRLIYLASLLLSIFFIFLISIRISILSLIAITAIYGVFYLKVSIKKKILSFSIGTLLFLSFIMLNPNIAKRFFVEESINKSITQFKELEPRVIIWDCAYQVTQQKDFSVLFGTTSYTNMKESMLSCYDDSIQDYSRKQWFLFRKYNTHNQYLDFYLIGGVLSLILLFLFLYFYIVKNRSNFFAIAIISSFFIMMSVENIFHRQFGCLIFAIFVVLIAETKKKQCQN